MTIGPEIATRVTGALAGFEDEMIAFLREIVAIPSYDGQLGEVGRVVGDRMRSLGFQDVRFDTMGNIVGRIGPGPRVLLYDSHLDTVGVSDRAAWQWDPFAGKVEGGILYALGAGDEKGSTPPMLYALHVLDHLGLLEGWTCYCFGNMEEWCDGIAGHALVEHEHLWPDFVVIGEPTRLLLYGGSRWARRKSRSSLSSARGPAGATPRSSSRCTRSRATPDSSSPWTRPIRRGRCPRGTPSSGPGKRRSSAAYGRPTDLGRWVFSTNGTYWMGKAGISSIGFGPGDERYAHTTLDQVPLDEVTASARFYALLPLALDPLLR